MIIIYLQSFIFSALGAFAVAKIMNTPGKMAYFAALIAACGFTLNTFLLGHIDNTISVFFATMLIVVLAEILARVFKYPATIFIFPALTPLLPGVRLYQTIMSLTLGDIDAAFVTGGQTILIALAIAMALVVTNTLARRYPIKDS